MVRCSIDVEPNFLSTTPEIFLLRTHAVSLIEEGHGTVLVPLKSYLSGLAGVKTEIAT